MHYVYKLTVGGQPYFGYTSRDPQERLKEHLDAAYSQNWKHNSKLYPMLVEMEFEYEFEVIGEHQHEVPALIQEIMEIREIGQDLTLNNSKGGEGATVNVRTREFKNGNFQYKVSLKRKPKRSTKPRSTRRKGRRR